MIITARPGRLGPGRQMFALVVSSTIWLGLTSVGCTVATTIGSDPAESNDPGHGDTAGVTSAPSDPESTSNDGDDTHTSADSSGEPTATGSDDATGSSTDPDVNPVEPCSSLDVLFVLDNSLSSARLHREVAETFPGFVAHLRTAFDDSISVHLGITTTSFSAASASESILNCESQATIEEVLEHYNPPGFADTNENGGQGRLYQYDGRTYYSGHLSDAEMLTWFEAATAAIGTHGCALEMDAAAAAYATSSDNDATNAGFVRDTGSLLIIIIVTEDPDKSPEAIEAYLSMIASAKRDCGGLDCVVAAGIVRERCFAGTDATDPTLYEFLTGFPRAPLIADAGCPDGECDFSPVLGAPLVAEIRGACIQLETE